MGKNDWPRVESKNEQVWDIHQHNNKAIHTATVYTKFTNNIQVHILEKGIALNYTHYKREIKILTISHISSLCRRRYAFLFSHTLYDTQFLN